MNTSVDHDTATMSSASPSRCEFLKSYGRNRPAPGQDNPVEPGTTALERYPKDKRYFLKDKSDTYKELY